jgi:hypothetical protein
MNLVIIIGGFPFSGGSRRWSGCCAASAVLVLMLLARLSKSVRKLLSRHQLGTTLAVAFVAMVLSDHHFAHRSFHRHHLGRHVVGMGDDGHGELRRCGAAQRRDGCSVRC